MQPTISWWFKSWRYSYAWTPFYRSLFIDCWGNFLMNKHYKCHLIEKHYVKGWWLVKKIYERIFVEGPKIVQPDLFMLIKVPTTQNHWEKPPKSNLIAWEILVVQIFQSSIVPVPIERRFLKKLKVTLPQPMEMQYMCWPALLLVKINHIRMIWRILCLKKNQFGLPNGRASENVSGWFFYNTPYFLLGSS